MPIGKHTVCVKHLLNKRSNIKEGRLKQLSTFSSVYELNTHEHLVSSYQPAYLISYLFSSAETQNDKHQGKYSQKVDCDLQLLITESFVTEDAIPFLSVEKTLIPRSVFLINQSFNKVN